MDCFILQHFGRYSLDLGGIRNLLENVSKRQQKEVQIAEVKTVLWDSRLGRVGYLCPISFHYASVSHSRCSITSFHPSSQAFSEVEATKKVENVKKRD